MHFSATSPTLEARWLWFSRALDALVISGHKSHFAPKHLIETLTTATIAQALVDSAERRETSYDFAIASLLDVCRCELSTVAHWLIDFERHVAVLDEKGFRCCHLMIVCRVRTPQSLNHIEEPITVYILHEFVVFEISARYTFDIFANCQFACHGHLELEV